VKSKPEKIGSVDAGLSSRAQNDVEEPPEASRSKDQDLDVQTKRSAGRIVRPSTSEVRHEAMRLSLEPGLSEFDRGVKTALEWILGDRKTLRRTDK
jgi:hypothetical protein